MTDFTLHGIFFESATDLENGPEGRFIYPATVVLRGTLDLAFFYDSTTSTQTQTGSVIENLGIETGSLLDITASGFNPVFHTLTNTQISLNQILSSAVFGSASAVAILWQWGATVAETTTLLIISASDSDEIGFSTDLEFIFPIAGAPLPEGWQNSFTVETYLDVIFGGAVDTAIEGVPIQADEIATASEFDVSTPLLLVGTQGDDTLIGNAGDDFLDGGTGGGDLILGGLGNDSLLGRDADDILNGGPGNDLIAAGDGSDFVEGGDGSDNIGGGFGDDTLYGGHDTNGSMLSDLGGNHTIGGGLGNDRIFFGLGTHVASGGPGDDLILSEDGALTAGGSFGNDTIFASSFDDNLGGGFGQDRLSAGAGNDLLGGGAGRDTLSGQAGNDFVAGGAGDDSISGGEGDDTLNSGAGNDTLRGSDGADVFVFRSGFGGVDRIVDFESGVDTIQLLGFDDPDAVQVDTINGGIVLTVADQQIRLIAEGLAPSSSFSMDDLLFV